MKKKIAVLFLVFSMVFISCDQDFNTIGADLVGDEHFDLGTYEVQGLKAYSKATNEVQTNNLPINPLGFYNNPYFGQTKANFVTQVALSTAQPKFGTSVQVDNVILYVPYFSTLESTNTDGSQVFSLDSIYGVNKLSKMKLSVYENGYYLNSFDPNNNFQTSQRYYNDMDNLIEAQKLGADALGNSSPTGQRLNNSTNVSENDEFFFNKAEIVIYNRKYNSSSGEFEYVDSSDNFIVPQTNVTPRVVKSRLAPGMYLTMNKDFFKKKILDASASNMVNNNAFRQYFKGLYFKMEQIAGEEGAMAMLNFNNAKINFNYSSINALPAEQVVTYKTFEINLGVNAGGNTVSLQDFSYSGAYNTGLNASASNPTFGSDSNLFLKGGKGSVVYMDVFGDADVLKVVDGQLVSGANGTPDELDELRLKGWLINDAYIEFYIDKSVMAGVNQNEAERIYLFDATNQKALADYAFDSSTNTNPKNNKYVYGGIIQRDDTAANKGIKYKIRITQHINNLINSSNVNLNKNVKLGLCVTENILLTLNFYYKNPLTFNSGPNIEYFPVSSIMSQQGIVLHGTNPALPANADKKLKLTIHYTKPN